MKKAKKLLSLLAISLLTSCGNTTITTSDKASHDSTSKTEQISVNSNKTNSSNSSNTDQTYDPTSPVVPVDKIDSEAVVSDLLDGFTADTLLTSGTESMGYTSNYMSFATTSKAYSFIKYASAGVGFANKNSISSKGLYQPFTNNGTTYLTQVELGLDNKIHNYYLVGSDSSYITWKKSGYYNPFSSLYGSDFSSNSTNPYQLDLKMNDTSKTDIYQNIANCFTGIIGYTLESFSLLTNGVSAYGYKMTFASYQTSYGENNTYANGTFGEERNEDVVEILTPFEGEEKSDLNERLKALKVGNYKADITLPNRSYKAEVYGNKSVIYDLYHTDNTKFGSYGYYQISSNKVQGITRIGNDIYLDSSSIDGVMSSMLPSFNISSVLFDKSNKSTSEKTIYKLNEDIASKLSVEEIYYGLLGSTVLGSLTIEIEQDKTTIINDMKNVGEEKFVYYDLGKVTDFTTNIHSTCDSLKWSQIFSNQPTEYQALISSTIDEELLDTLPVIGGTSSYITLVSNTKRGLVQAVVSISNYNDGINKIEAYKTKCEEAGFTITKKESQTLNYVISKDVTVEGKTKTISADILLAASYFDNPSVVITFSCK